MPRPTTEHLLDGDASVTRHRGVAIVTSWDEAYQTWVARAGTRSRICAAEYSWLAVRHACQLVDEERAAHASTNLPLWLNDTAHWEADNVRATRDTLRKRIRVLQGVRDRARCDREVLIKLWGEAGDPEMRAKLVDVFGLLDTCASRLDNLASDLTNGAKF